METAIVELYAGDSWDCEMIQSLLTDVEIECFLQNNLPVAYAYLPPTEQTVKVMIKKTDFDAASEIVNMFLESRR